MMARAARWTKPGLKGPVPCDPPMDYARTLLAKRPVGFDYLLGVANCPVMRADGTVVQAEGYDRATGLLLDFGGTKFPEVPDSPTREDAGRALALLKRPFRAYDFEDSASASVVYSVMLTPAISRVVPAVPLHVVDASTAGYGKSKIADCASIMATGVRAPVFSQGKSQEEDEKRIGAALRAGDAVVVIDNVDEPIKGDTLCSAITQSTVSLRILGQSLIVTLDARTLFIANGKNVRVEGDLCRRTLRCRIEGGHERPDKREFDFDPVEEVEAQRAALVVAALTVLRAYIVAGRPVRKQVPPLGSFEGWNIVREALVWLGEADPADTREEVMGDDEERGEMAAQLDALWKATGGAEFKVADLRRLASEHEVLNELLAAFDIAGEWTGKSVSAKLNKLRDRRIDGKVLVRPKKDGKRGHTYRVEQPGAEKVEPPAKSERVF